MEIPDSAVGSWDMEKSKDFRRIAGGPVLVDTQPRGDFPTSCERPTRSLNCLRDRMTAVEDAPAPLHVVRRRFRYHLTKESRHV